MPMLKIGTRYYNGNAQHIYLIQGNATRDGEDAPVNGKDHAKVSIAAAQQPDESTVFVTVNGWRDRAAEVAAISKMDSVLAIGALKKREYNGRFYYDLDADFIITSGGVIGSAASPAYDRGTSYTDVAADLPDFTEIPDDTDGELPF